MFLVIEDSPIVQKILRHTLRQQQVEPVVFASTKAEGVEAFEKHKDGLIAAIVDISLPDAPQGEMVNYIVENKLPCIVLTGTDDEEQRKKLLKLGAADYVIKENRFSYQYAVRMLDRLARNRKIKALVVDDSTTMRQVVSYYMKLQCFDVIEAKDGREALELLESEPDIRLVITDYNMPNMDGFRLTQEIRYRYEKRPIAIIGLSSQEDSNTSVQFIKKGANDFLQKPFQQEEFGCRVTNNIEALEQLISLHEQATLDYLTGLNNRRYFIEEGNELVKKYRSSETDYAVALMDLDNFKGINDEHGHEAGDAILTQFGEYLRHAFSRFHLARYGGEEFVVVIGGLDESKVFDLVDQFRHYISEQIFILPDDDYIRVSVSVGIAGAGSTAGLDLKDLLQRADEALYQAKEAGRNMVVPYSPE